MEPKHLVLHRYARLGAFVVGALTAMACSSSSTSDGGDAAVGGAGSNLDDAGSNPSDAGSTTGPGVGEGGGVDGGRASDGAVVAEGSMSATADAWTGASLDSGSQFYDDSAAHSQDDSGANTAGDSGAPETSDSGVLVSPDGAARGGADAEGGAPLDWSFQGTPETWQGISWSTPAHWTTAVASDGVTLTAPTDTGSCAIAILPARDAAADQSGRQQQLLDILTTEFAGHTLADEYGNWPAKTGITRGVSGSGVAFVGYKLDVDNTLKLDAYLAVFGSSAVPVIALANKTNGACLLSSEGQVNGLEVFHSLSMNGFVAALALDPPIVGNWFSGETDIGIELDLAADGTFVRADVYSGSYSSYSSTSSGTYSVHANIISFQTDKAAENHYFRTYETSNTSSASGWDKYYCEISLESTAPYAAYELCYWQS